MNDLSAVLKQLGIQQKDLAEDVDVTAAAISKHFAVGAKHVPLSLDKQKTLFESIEAQILRIHDAKQGKEITGLSEERAERLFQSATAIEQSDLEQCKKDLARAQNGGVTPIERVNVNPRGPLSVRALNYINRIPDEHVQNILETISSPASIVVSPIQGGTTSFLNRIYDMAGEMDNCLVRMSSLDMEFADGEMPLQTELFKAMFHNFGVPRENLSGDVQDMKEAFHEWAENTWSKYERIVLIVDGLDALFKKAGTDLGSSNAVLAVLNWMAGLRNVMARGEEPFDKLILFTAFTGRTWSAAHASPFGTQAGQISLEKWTPDAVQQLFSLFEISIGEYKLGQVYDEFYGHPFLTHLFAWEITQNSTYEEVIARVVNGENDFGRHWGRMQEELGYLTTGSVTIESVFEVVLRKCGGQHDGSLPDSRVEALWQNFHRDLRMYGLIDGDTNKPTICGFYKRCIERELSSSNSESST